MMMPRKGSKKAVELPPLEPVRELESKPCASCMAEPEIAAKMVAHGWHAVGTSGGQYIMIADAKAVSSYIQEHGGDSEKEAE